MTCTDMALSRCVCVCVFYSINSTIHAVMIVAGMLTTVLRQQWDDDLMPLGSTSAATALFSFCTRLFAPRADLLGVAG